MSIQEFFDKYNGQGIDFDGFYGNQCMDEFLQYNQDVVHAPRVWGNAVDVWTNYPTAFYDQIPNKPDNVPQSGDVMIWGTGIGQYGHIAIFRDGNVNEFTSLDQNWNSVQSCQFISHNYNAVLGWIRPKIFAPQPVVEQPIAPVVNTPPEVVNPVVNQPLVSVSTTEQNIPPVDASATEVIPTPEKILPQPEVIVSTPPLVVPSVPSSEGMPPIQTKPLPIPMPVKPRMDIRSHIVFILLKIKSVLSKYFK